MLTSLVLAEEENCREEEIGNNSIKASSTGKVLCIFKYNQSQHYLTLVFFSFLLLRLLCSRCLANGLYRLQAATTLKEKNNQLFCFLSQVLTDLFSFDIKDYLDEEEEDTTSKASATLSDDVKRNLEDISHQLGSSLDSLVADCGSIRARFKEIQPLIPDYLANVITLAAYLEQHQFKLKKGKQRLVDRRERKDIETTIQANRQLVHEVKSKLDQLSEGPIKSNIDRLEARKIELLALLQECNAELSLEQQKLANLPKAIEEQKLRLKSAIRNIADMTKSLKVIPGTDAQDAQAIEEVKQIRQRAISAIQ